MMIEEHFIIFTQLRIKIHLELVQSFKKQLIHNKHEFMRYYIGFIVFNHCS